VSGFLLLFDALPQLLDDAIGGMPGKGHRSRNTWFGTPKS
jgi:hypothetical protein